MTFPATLKSDILNIIQKDNFNINDLKNVLTPISNYIDDPVFTQNVDDIIDIITKDRNGDKKFDIADLQLMVKDMPSMTSLITALLLMLSAIPGFKLKYTLGQTEEFVVKLLVYIFLITVPNKLGINWTPQEQQTIMNMVDTVFNMIKTSQVTKVIIDKITSWFKSKNWCSCCSGTTSKDDVLTQKLPEVKTDLALKMNDVKAKSETQTVPVNTNQKI